MKDIHNHINKIIKMAIKSKRDENASSNQCSN